MYFFSVVYFSMALFLVVGYFSANPAAMLNSASPAFTSALLFRKSRTMSNAVTSALSISTRRVIWATSSPE